MPGRFGFIPNLLTVLRLVLAAAFPFADERWRAALLVAALLTEFFDGMLARRFGWESRAGRILDPIADRCLFGAVVFTLLAGGAVSWAQLAALGARDVLVAGGALWIVARGEAAVLRRMHPRLAGKATTALQYVALLCVVFGLGLPGWLAGAIAAIGLYAAAEYMLDFRRLRGAAEDQKE